MNGKEIPFDYPAAARTIALWLEEFCDKSLPYPEMIADAVRKVAREHEDLQQKLDTALDVIGELRFALDNAVEVMVATQTYKYLRLLPGAVHIGNEALSGTSNQWESPRETEMELRQLLWLHHGHNGLYGDDGEMMCNTCMLDFKRDSIDTIADNFRMMDIHAAVRRRNSVAS